MKKRILCMILCMILAFSDVLVSLASSLGTTQTSDTSAETEGLNVTSRTAEEIRAFCDENPASLDQVVTYAAEPSLSEPYSAGVLSDETQQSALNLINQCRFIAGLNADVALDSEYSEAASAATFLNGLNDELSHYPDRPEVLADDGYTDLYTLGYDGAGSSNIAAGYANLNKAIIQGWMSDSDDSNIDRVGHRRWILNPAMGKIGFGMTENSQSIYKYYYAMYAHDQSGTGTQTRVAWPAQNMPIQYFNDGDAWSVSFGKELSADDIQVTLVRDSDNTEWSFNSSASNGIFYVENSYYGQKGCIIFRPDSLTEVEAGDSFHVTISGVETADISYQVTFFDLQEDSDETGDSEIQKVASGTCGENVTWTYLSDGDLIISGSGVMNDYTTESSVSSGITTDVPWGEYLSGIQRIVFEGDITYIGKCAFSDCTSLSEIIWPDAIEKIGAYAFTRCRALTMVTVPDSVTVVGSYAFCGCSNLQKIVFPDGCSSWGSDLFSGCKKLSEINLPETLDDIPYATFNQCASLKNIQLPNSLEEIGPWAFAGCSALEEITIPHSVSLIDKEAFQSCSSLNQIYIYAKMPDIDTSKVFPDRSTCTIYCYKNSMAEAYLKCQGYTSVCSYITEDDGKEILAEVTGYDGVYDGEEHFISIDVTNVSEGSYEIYYSPYSEIYTLNADGTATWFTPLKRSAFKGETDAGELTVYYYICADGYPIKKGSADLVIDKAQAGLSFADGTIEAKSDDYGCTNKLTAATDGTITYSSSDESVATVNAKGFIDFQGVGTCTITAKSAETTNYMAGEASCIVIVSKPDPKDAELSAYAGSDVLLVGNTTSVRVSTKSDGTITYTSSNPSVATVSSNGVITGISGGTTTITVTSAATDAYLEGTDSFTLEVKKPTVSLGNCVTTLEYTRTTYDGTAKTPAVTETYNGQLLKEGTDYTVSYANNTNAGTATVTIKGINSYTGTITQTFTIAKANQVIQASISGTSVEVGNTAQITVKRISGNGNISYSSSNTEIAAVSTSGVVAGVGAGTATITVKAAGTSNYNAVSVQLTVKVPDPRPSQTSISSLTNSSTGIVLKWSAVSNATGYIIYRKTGSETSWTKVKTMTNSSTVSWTDTGAVTSGTKYSYYVRTYRTLSGKNYYGSNSSTKTSYYLKVPSVSLSNAANGITVKWSKISGATGYIVYRKAGSETSWTRMKTITSGSTVSWTDTSAAKSGTKYIYCVKAYKTASGVNYYSAYKGKTIYRLSRPSASLSNAASGITIKWGKISGATGYIVYRKAGSETSWTRMKTITSGSTVSWTDAKATKNGTKYIYCVKAYKTVSGTNYYSNYSSKTLYRLSRPAISSLKNSASKTLKAVWGKNSKATGYQLQYSTSSKFTGAITKTYGSYKTVSASVSKLTKGKTYYVRVRAYKTVSGTKYYSAWSAVKKVKISK